MRKVIVSEYISLDGVMEEPGHWSFQFWSEEAAQFKYNELFASDGLLLGRVTYQGLMTVDKKHIVSYTISSSFERNDRYGQASSKTVSRRSSSP
jgi:dihydrofolate reductase